MEGTWRVAALTAVAPVAWGTTYWVTRDTLPADTPLWGGVARALPAGLLLLLVARRRPTGVWWWRSAVLRTLTTGLFFALVYVAAARLPTSIASTVMATSPVVMMLFAWALLARRPRALPLLGAGIGVAGVALLLLTGTDGLDPWGVAASAAAMLMSAAGFVLAQRWQDGTDLVAATSWQLVAGGLVLLPFAVATEGAPPALDGPAVAGQAYITLVATAVAFLAWFGGLRRASTPAPWA